MPEYADTLVYLVFPAALVLVIFCLWVGPYRKLEDVNRAFDGRRRPASFQALLKALFVCAIGIFATMQLFRVSFYVSVIGALGSLSLDGSDVLVSVMTVLSVGVLLAELLVLLHLCTYLVLSWIGVARFRSPTIPPLPADPPPVAVLIPSCDEDTRSLERSLSSVLRSSYPRYRVWLVENSRDPEFKRKAHRLCARHGVECVDIPNRGHKAGALNDAERLLGLDVKYTVVFDADQRMSGDLISDGVALLEADESLGFVQTPQVYENSKSSLLACAASQQQMLLYDGPIEGKGALGRTPCYGSNFIVRRKALAEIGGWDESNLTEDLTTSYHFHAAGWRSLYVRRIYAMGLAPASLDAYWQQQLRWAEGNTTLLFRLVGDLLRGRLRSVRAGVVIDYLLAASFYVNTFAISLIAVYPAVMLTLDLGFGDSAAASAPAGPSQFSRSLFVSFYPLYLIVAFFSYFNMGLRGYPLRNLVLLQGLVAITSPVYLRGVRRAIFGRGRATFESSKKFVETGARRGWRASMLATPQVVVACIFVLAGSILTHRGLTGPASAVLWIVVFWAFVHSFSLTHFLLLRLDEARRATTEVPPDA